MTKNNSRSFRFSDATLHQLESFEGDSLTEKFENIIAFCFLNEAAIKKSIASKNIELENLRAQCAAKRGDLSALIELERFKGVLMLSIGDLIQKIRTFSDKTDREV